MIKTQRLSIEYDDQGRVVYYKDCTDSSYKLFEKAYDENGNIISKKQTHEGYVGSAGFPDKEFEYQYNEHNDLILKEVTQEGDLVIRQTYSYEYDKNGNITSMTDSFWNKNDKGEETSVVSIYTYTYDEHNLLVAEEKRYEEGTFKYLNVYYYKAILVPAS